MATIEQQFMEQVRKEQVEDYHNLFTLIKTSAGDKVVNERTENETASFDLSRPDTERKAVKNFSDFT